MVSVRDFGVTKNGRPVQEYVLENKHGLQVSCIGYGCRLTGLFVPGEGGPTNILLGYNTLAAYEEDSACHGAFIGRYAGRIRDARFTLEGREHQLTSGQNGDYLHGSFHNQVWSTEAVGENSISFSGISPAGEDGFPGDVWVGVTYTLTDQNEFVLDYRATTRADTHLSLTNHSYFNLAGAEAGSLKGQYLWLSAGQFLEADPRLLPTGALLPAQSAFDFTEEKPLLRDIAAGDPQLALAGGYDHCFVLDKQRPDALSLAAIARHPASGRAVRLFTTQPAIQLYSGNGLGGGPPAPGGKPYAHQSGFCLETQHYPDSPNHPAFPSTLLEVGDQYHQITALHIEW